MNAERALMDADKNLLGDLSLFFVFYDNFCGSNSGQFFKVRNFLSGGGTNRKDFLEVENIGFEKRYVRGVRNVIGRRLVIRKYAVFKVQDGLPIDPTGRAAKAVLSRGGSRIRKELFREK